MATQFNIDKLTEMIKDLPPPPKDQVVFMGQSSFGKFCSQTVGEISKSLSIPVQMHKYIPDDAVFITDRTKPDLSFGMRKLELKKPFVYKERVIDKRSKKKHGKTTATSIRRRRKQQFPKKHIDPVIKLLAASSAAILREMDNRMINQILTGTV
jgi:hypothetical protein